jgi:plastocyanin
VRAYLVVAIASAFLFGLLGGTALAVPPHPDPNFLTQVTDSPCKLDTTDPIEKQSYEQEGFGAATDYTRYPGNCRRIHFAYGPIVVKPGQNDVLINPITIDKPGEDGYITRFKPNLVDQDGKVPPVEQVHLHHGTWLSEPSYGNSAFFAAGEEKTIAPFPKGYGMPVKRTDTWLLLYMVHSAVQNPMTVWITYDVDFVPEANAMALGLKPVIPVWMDVRPSAYPVFNVQRKFGDANGECTWPKQECADFDPYGKTLEGQGQPGNGLGTDLKLPSLGGAFGSDSNFTGGTLIGIGGHLHPGGIRNEIDLVRDGQSQRIYNGIPTYWDHTDQTKGGGPGTSWDFSMRVSGLPKYGVHMKPGDVLRSNAVYDTKTLASYEDMGIVVALMAPDDAKGNPTAPGVDPFTAPVDNSDRCDSGGLLAATPTLCPNGNFETHSHYVENGNYSGPAPGATLDAADGPSTNNITIGDFLYAPGDLSQVQTTGIPTVKLGSNLTFTNADSALDVYHTITTCRFPCLGATGSAFPLADGQTSTGRQIDLDSSELGYGIPTISGVKNEAQWSIPITQDQGYQPGEVVTYFCRIHPSMRGAFKVVQ